MIRISKYQLFCLVVLFETGSTTLFALGIKAKQDAWIAVLLAMLGGFVLLWIYTELQKFFPDKNFAQIIISLLGKFIGVPLVFLYALLFFYISARNFREFGELIVVTFLHETPLIAILIVFILVVIYILSLGLEVFSRTSEIMLPVVLFFIISMYIMIAISGNVNLKELTPVLAKGMTPVLNAAYPTIVNFPFGGVLVFLMYWCYSDSKKAFQKISFLAVGISGLLLSVSLVIIISVLGVDYASTATIPLLEVIKLVNIGDILTNLDAIGIIVIFVGGFYKMAIYFYGSISALSTLLKIKDIRWVIVPASILMVWFGITFEPNYPYHMWLGFDFCMPYIRNPFDIIIPPLLLIICWLKKKINKISVKNSSKGGS